MLLFYRLKDWPEYCGEIINIPHFSQFPLHLQWVITLLTTTSTASTICTGSTITCCSVYNMVNSYSSIWMALLVDHHSDHSLTDRWVIVYQLNVAYALKKYLQLITLFNGLCHVFVAPPLPGQKPPAGSLLVCYWSVGMNWSLLPELSYYWLVHNWLRLKSWICSYARCVCAVHTRVRAWILNTLTICLSNVLLQCTCLYLSIIVAKKLI